MSAQVDVSTSVKSAVRADDGFVARIFAELEAHRADPMVTEVVAEGDGAKLLAANGAELLALIATARAALRARGVRPGDRVATIAPNSIRWVAFDLALLAEGAIAVPLYARQAANELCGMMRDCGASLVVCATEALASAVRTHWSDAPIALFSEVWSTDARVHEPPIARGSDDVVTLVYTSGTSGEPKGVMLTEKGVSAMLPITRDALVSMIGKSEKLAAGERERVFHYLPFCFAGSRIVLWTCLFRGVGIMVSTDLDKLAVELKSAKPHYFLNVPALLERIRRGVEAKIGERGKVATTLYQLGKSAFAKLAAGQGSPLDRAAYALSKRIVFDKIRAQIGADLECLICGSALLAEDTQRWFQMIGIPVYQVYGLTETTAIVTMDEPGHEEPGKVGRVVRCNRVKIGDGDELWVSGDNVFAGYWNRQEATAEAFVDSDGIRCFRTGDQVEIDATGNLKIVGRVKNVLVPSSGHNVAPEPIESAILDRVPSLTQAVIVGHGKPFLVGLFTGTASRTEVERAVSAINETLPHYKRVRSFHLTPELFTVENGLLTANQKLRRKAIEAHHKSAIEALYRS